MIKPDLSVVIPEYLGHLHFVGVGGSGMSGIARMYLQAGFSVSGSDRDESPKLDELRALGATISVGHDAKNAEGASTLVVTSALWPENPEYRYAIENNIPILHRSQALAALGRGKRLVAVAGAHGKTTSTGMLVSGMLALGESPSFVNGGVIEPLGVSSDGGTGDLFVIEADESDGSFLLYDTAVALITNVDSDHLDHYGSLEAFDEAFIDFADRTNEFVAISSDDPGALRITARLAPETRVLTFGEAADADVRVHSIITDGPVRFSVHYDGADYSTELRVPGHHNALNAAGAFTVLVGLGFDPAASLAAVATFGGTQRRFELHGTVGGVSVYDDYAHHPTEVDAALTAARSVVGEGRIIAVQQPHLFSRTMALAGEFAETLERVADHTVVLDICAAREDPIPGITGEIVSERWQDPTRVHYEADWQAAADYVASVARPGDFVITLGCGDVYKLVPQLLASLENGGR
ncbi:UDP-N-acetylmuramate--L-alanine ligase [Mycetocola spongiae]|uniref:UDP-N-acetylmuramate--L-alanine ligase n=1 Tax=Mycetocola spongiae TaxID=2859226 RepID=UPI001CF38860|nr:UDP-N-acetylmuramate--L-alanine ligase [Mycetocola spongiae]UCR89782.1 UDP-N-acetylmuramate--L-alanine ligase [Mycetocola spongiae]